MTSKDITAGTDKNESGRTNAGMIQINLPMASKGATDSMPAKRVHWVAKLSVIQRSINP